MRSEVDDLIPPRVLVMDADETLAFLFLRSVVRTQRDIGEVVRLILTALTRSFFHSFRLCGSFEPVDRSQIHFDTLHFLVWKRLIIDQQIF